MVTGTHLHCPETGTSIDVSMFEKLTHCLLCGKILNKGDIVGKFQPIPQLTGDRPSVMDILATTTS